MSVTRLDALVHRTDDTRSTLPNPHGVPVTLFANRDVPIELEAVEQALAFVDVQGTIADIARADIAVSSQLATSMTRGSRSQRWLTCSDTRNQVKERRSRDGRS